MGKKSKTSRPKHKQTLEEQMTAPEAFGVRADERKRVKRQKVDQEEDEELATKVSNKILKEAKAQLEEIDAEGGQEGGLPKVSNERLNSLLQKALDSDDEDDDVADVALPRAKLNFDDEGDAAWSDGEDDMWGGDVEVSAEDEKALAAFMAVDSENFRQQSLSDMILAKIREKQSQQGLSVLPEPGEEPVPEGLDNKVLEVYSKVGQLLSRYTVGPMPKAFKIIPGLKNWDDVLFLTGPETWSPHATYQATRIFVSNLNANLAQRFLALVLLPKVREEIRDKQKLHFALFQAVKKAAYKPGAFYKGLLLPLCASRTCTLREAVIFTSVLKRVSLPVLHSAAALLRLADMEYCGTTSFFIRVLLEKKYALPYRTVDALVDHFIRFMDDERQMPVVWHQTLLTFVQLYKDQIREEDRASLRKLCQHQHHYQVTPEVLRELDHAKPRGQKANGPSAMEVKPSVGKNVTEDVKRMAPVIMMDEE